MPSYIRSGAALTVSSLNAATQMRSSITALGDGGFVVVWQSSDPNADGSGYAVRAQRYNAQGAAVGTETTISNSTAGDQNWPRIATLASGGYVVTWDTSDTTQDGSGSAIKARLFDAAGVPIGGEFRVNTHAVADQKQPNVVGLSDGGFLIAWETTDPAQDGAGSAVKGQRFDSTGAAVGAEFLINTPAGVSQSNIDLAATANGGFVATWQSTFTGGAGTQVKGQVFGADGARIGSEFFASNGTGTHTSGRVAALPGGGFILTWSSAGSSLAQFFDPAGNKVGAQFTIAGSNPEAAALADGTVLVTWWTTSGSVKAQVYDTAGQRLGPETTVFQGGGAAGLASMQSMALLANGNVVLSWDHIHSGTGDIDIRAQILRPNTGVEIGAATRAVSVAENGQIVTNVVPADSAGVQVSYSIVGGTDAARFTIDATGQLRFAALPNFEAPTDSNGDNVYEVIVRASDGEYSDDQTISVTVTNVNEAPSITSNGGGNNASITVAENQNAVTTVTATDPDAAATLTYSIVSGADRSRFAINASTGVLTFVSAPNFEVRQDANGDNVYDVTVAVSDGSKSDTQALSVTVANVNEGVTISGSQTHYLHIENGTAVASFSATDLDGDSLTWSIAGGADAARFAIDPVTGALRFVTAPNFEAPADAGADNVYNVTISASDGSLSATRALTIEILNRNEGPVIVSGGGGDSASVSVPENTGFVTTIVADDPDASDSPYSFSITGGADAALFIIQAQTGQLFFKSSLGGNFEAPTDADGDNVYEVIVVASDGFEPADAQAVSVTVTDANDAPVIASNGGGSTAALSLSENQLAVTTVTAIDADNAALTYGIAGGADAALFTIDAQTGLLSFISAPDREAPVDAGANNVYNVIVSVSDGGKSDTQALSITILDSNEAPIITSNGGGSAAAISMAENGLAATTVAAADPEGGALYYAISGGADASRFSIDSVTGALTFLMTPDYEQPADSGGDNVYDVTVSASDGVFSDDQALSITVGDANERPIIVSNGGGTSAFVELDEGQTAVTTVVAADPDGAGAVTYSITGGAHADLFVIDAATGVLSFAAAPDYEAPPGESGNFYSVTVTASDGELSSFQSVQVAVRNVNEGIFITSNGGDNSAALTIDEGTSHVTTVVAYDPDGGTPSYSITGGADASRFTIDSATGILSFVEAPDYEAPLGAGADNFYEVIVTAGDGELSSSQFISVLIGNVNEGVTITSGGGADSVAVTIDEDRAVVANVSAVDADGTPVFYSIAGGADAAFFGIDPLSGELRIANVDYEAHGDADGDNVYEVIVAADDGWLSDFQAYSVTLVDVDEPLFFTSYNSDFHVSLEVGENSRDAAVVAAEDPEGAAIVYSIVDSYDGASFTIDAQTGVLRFLTAPDHEAPGDLDGDNVYTVLVSATDGNFFDYQTISVQVVDVNDRPTITTGPALSVNEDSAFVTQVIATDGDGDPLSYAIVGGEDASHFVIDPETGDLSIRASLDFEAPADADGDNVYEVTVRASDGQLSDERQMSITVNDVDDDVEIVSYGGADSVSMTVQEGSFQVADVDASLSPFRGVRFAIGGADAALFTVDPYSGILSFKYPFIPDFEAPADADGDNVYDVVVTVSMATSSDSQAFAITVTNRNEGLWITSDGGGDASLSVNEGDRNVTTVTAYDRDGDVPTYSIVGGADAALFAIDPVTGVLTFIAAPDYEAPHNGTGTNFYTVEVGASDGEYTSRQKIQVGINNVNEGLAITSGGGGEAFAVTVAENGTAATSVAASDVDGDPVTYSIAGGADASRFTINAQTGALSFVQAANFEAPADVGTNNVYDVVVSASDGVFTDTQAIAVTVGNVNEGVTITSNGGGAGASVAVAENGIAVVTVSASDADGGSVTYAIAGGADAARFRIDAATGALAFVSAPNFEAPSDAGANNVYEVIVSASDGAFTDTQAIAVQVGNVNEAPAITSNGGGASAVVSVAENSVGVTTVGAVDPDGTAVTYSIVGGTDAGRFTINTQTGVLQFVAAPDYELPTDANGDNVYGVIVRASDGQITEDQGLNVVVTNLRDGNNVTGTSGNDSISASSANVALRTSNEEDTVFGRDGHDDIQGMAGDDDLYGEGGNDTLVGGAGLDRLTGGLGKDQFTYNSVSESTATARDLILDFSRSQGDKISLSAIDANSGLSGNQAFTFIGTAAFSNVAGQLRYETSGGLTTIFGDVNGDGVADLQIQLSGSVALIASDFVL
jgi:hypothetical protein